MTVSLWRIATDTPNYTSDDMSGAGAKVSGGRWNRPGNAMLYTASNIALACLETIVHINASGLPLNRYLVRIEIPDQIWRRRTSFPNDAATVGWDAEPAGKVSLDYGDHWLASGRSALLIVPSVIVAEEHNVLINPAHADTASIKATKLRKWQYDARLL